MTEKPEVSEFGSVDPAPASSNGRVSEWREIICNEEERMFMRMRALFALRNVGGPEALDALAAAFSSDSALLKHEIAYVMGQMQDSYAVSCLVERLSDHDAADEDTRAEFFSMINAELGELPEDKINKFVESPGFELFTKMGELYGG